MPATVPMMYRIPAAVAAALCSRTLWPDRESLRTPVGYDVVDDMVHPPPLNPHCSAAPAARSEAKDHAGTPPVRICRAARGLADVSATSRGRGSLHDAWESARCRARCR